LKGIEKLATVKTSTLTDILPKIISRQIEEAARSVQVCRSLCRINRRLVGAPGRSVILPTRGTVTAADATEGQNMGSTFEGVTWSTATITPTKFYVPLRITQEALEADERDTIRDNISEAGYAMAEWEDSRIMNVLLGRTNTRDTTATFVTKTLRLTLSQSPVLSIASFYYKGDQLGSVKVDYEDGVCYLSTGTAGAAATVNYYYTSHNTTQYDYVAKPDVGLTYADYIDSHTKMVADKYRPNFVVMGAVGHGDLMKNITTSIKTLTQSAKDQELAMPGAIGRLGDATVLVTTQITDGNTLLIDSKRAGWIVDKRDITVKKDPTPSKDSVEWYVTKMSIAHVSQSKALRIIGGTQSNATNY
jgi:hypothetical protein